MKAMMMAVVGGMFPNKLACTKRERRKEKVCLEVKTFLEKKSGGIAYV